MKPSSQNSHYQGTAEQLSEGIIVNRKGRPVTYTKNNRVRIFDGKVSGIRKIAGIFCFEDGNESITLEILPKGMRVDSPSSSVNMWLQIFQSIREIDSSGIAFDQHDEFAERIQNRKVKFFNIIDPFMLHLVEDIEEALKHAVPSKFEPVDEISESIKGRINWPVQISKLHGFMHKHAIHYSTRNDDFLPYSFLKTGSKLIFKAFQHFIDSQDLKARVRNIDRDLRKFPDCHLPSVKNKMLDFLRKPSGDKRLKKGVNALAKWIYSLETKSDALVSFSVHGFTINLERTFENWARKSIRLALPQSEDHQHLISSKTEEFWHWGQQTSPKDPNTRSCRILKPDIAVFENDKVVAIIDAKYKNFELENLNSEAEEDSGRSKSIDRHDMYQLFAYRSALEQTVAGLFSADKKELTKSELFRLYIAVPSEIFTTGLEFYSDSNLESSLCIVELPFNRFLKGDNVDQDILSFIKTALPTKKSTA